MNSLGNFRWELFACNLANNSQIFIKLHFAGDSVTCTLEHPFFVNNDWVAAKILVAGDSLTVFSGIKVKLDSVNKFKTDTATAVYNLEAAGNHNYYVSASKVLVHNKAATADFLAKLRKLTKKLNLSEINNYLFKDGEVDVIDLSLFNNKPGKYGKWILENERGNGHAGTIFKLKKEHCKGYWSLTREGKILRWKK